MSPRIGKYLSQYEGRPSWIKRTNMSVRLLMVPTIVGLVSCSVDDSKKKDKDSSERTAVGGIPAGQYYLIDQDGTVTPSTTKLSALEEKSMSQEDFMKYVNDMVKNVLASNQAIAAASEKPAAPIIVNVNSSNTNTSSSNSSATNNNTNTSSNSNNNSNSNSNNNSNSNSNNNSNTNTNENKNDINNNNNNTNNFAGSNDPNKPDDPNDPNKPDKPDDPEPPRPDCAATPDAQGCVDEGDDAAIKKACSQAHGASEPIQWLTKDGSGVTTKKTLREFGEANVLLRLKDAEVIKNTTIKFNFNPEGAEGGGFEGARHCIVLGNALKIQKLKVLAPCGASVVVVGNSKIVKNFKENTCTNPHQKSIDDLKEQLKTAEEELAGMDCTKEGDGKKACRQKRQEIARLKKEIKKLEKEQKKLGK